MSYSLRTRVLLGYGVALLLVAGLLSLALTDLFRLGRASDAILSENYRSIQAAEHMINALERQDSGVLLYLLGEEEAGSRQFRESQAEFLQWLGRAKDNVTIDGEEAILASLDSAYSTYLEAFARLVQRRDPGESPAVARDAYRGRLHAAFLPVRETTGRLRDLNEETMFAASDRADAVARRAVWTLGVAGLLAIGVGLAFGLVLSNRLVRPIREITDATARIAGGDYDVEVPERTGDELGDLARRFNEMADRLRAYRAMNVGELMAEKRKSEAIIRSIDDGLVVVDNQFRVVDLNPAAARILDHQGRDVAGLHFLEVVRNDTLFEQVRRTVESGRAAEIEDQQRFLTTDRSGERRHFEAVVIPVRGESDGLAGAILMLRDVTKLRELDRMKSEFVATASHELRTPLTSIAMSLDLVEEHAGPQLDAAERDLLQGTRADVERLRSLVSDLLDLSRIEAGRIELDIQAVDASLICERVQEVMFSQAEERAVILQLRLPEDLPEVRADVNKMTWVLTNLVSNALRYSESGARVEVSAAPFESSVHLTVRDEGEGIPYEFQSRIFDKFIQVEDGRRPEGTGLGLAICREIVRAHGGTIWVESEPGEGSSFTFTLPVAT